MKCSSRLKNALTPHVCALLSKGISVVLDFPGNTKTQRAWFRALIERANVEHELHFVDASDALCKSQLRDRSEGLPAGTPWTRDADFEAINAYFQPPTEDERFNVIRHERARSRTRLPRNRNTETPVLPCSAPTNSCELPTKGRFSRRT